MVQGTPGLLQYYNKNKSNRLIVTFTNKIHLHGAFSLIFNIMQLLKIYLATNAKDTFPDVSLFQDYLEKECMKSGHKHQNHCLWNSLYIVRFVSNSNLTANILHSNQFKYGLQSKVKQETTLIPADMSLLNWNLYRVLTKHKHWQSSYANVHQCTAVCKLIIQGTQWNWI